MNTDFTDDQTLGMKERSMATGQVFISWSLLIRVDPW
jgi:hypothetical protein